jgi:glycosyltransferase involved in cell wall biosynthesis
VYKRQLPLGRAPALLWLGRLTATKDPLTFLAALDLLPDLPWTARLVGPDAVEPAVAQQVARRIEAAGFAGRVAVTGPRVGPELEAVWAETDLLVHTSRAETYGMVVAEALARGVPAVVASGTGAVEALRVGATFPQGDPVALSQVLRGWLADPGRQGRWRAEAARLSADRPTWQGTTAAVASALAG